MIENGATLQLTSLCSSQNQLNLQSGGRFSWFYELKYFTVNIDLLNYIFFGTVLLVVTWSSSCFSSIGTSRLQRCLFNATILPQKNTPTFFCAQSTLTFHRKISLARIPANDFLREFVNFDGHSVP